MKIITPWGTTSYIGHVFIQDSTSVVGAGLTGLAFGSSGIKMSYIRSGEAAATALTPETITTLGTFAAPTSAAHIRFKETDATNMPGFYEIQLPDALLNATSSRKSIILTFFGAANMMTTNIEIQLSVQAESLATQAKADVNGEVLDVFNVDTYVELTGGSPATGGSTMRQWLQWVFTLSKTKNTCNGTTQTIFKDDGSTTLATSTVSNSGATVTKGKYT